MRWYSGLRLALGIAGAAARKCQDVSFSLNLSFRNAVFNLAAPASTVDMTNFFLDYTRNGHNYSNELLTGYTTISRTYTVAATFCTPDYGPAGTTLQILTHGITLDRSYWDIPFHNHNYSYVAAAVDQYNYSTLAWDLLGVGNSQRGDPVSELQYNLQNAALHALTVQLRTGGGSGSGIRGVPAFRKIVHVGHSYGSMHVYTLGVRYPNASDGLVLTGFSHSSVGFVPFLLGGGFVPARQLLALADYPAGFFANGAVEGLQAVFFGKGNFDPGMLEYTFDTLSAAAVGEILTLGPDLAVTSGFAGPVLVITGERDLGFCLGSCSTSLLDMTNTMIPNASPFQSVVVPGAGHVLNAEYTHPLAFKTILDFVTQNV